MAEALPREAAPLLVAPLADFVRARDALAAELRAAGRSPEAADVKRLRKPSPDGSRQRSSAPPPTAT